MPFHSDGGIHSDQICYCKFTKTITVNAVWLQYTVGMKV